MIKLLFRIYLLYSNFEKQFIVLNHDKKKMQDQNFFLINIIFSIYLKSLKNINENKKDVKINIEYKKNNNINRRNNRDINLINQNCIVKTINDKFIDNNLINFVNILNFDIV